MIRKLFYLVSVFMVVGLIGPAAAQAVDMEIGFGTPVIDGQVDDIWADASVASFVPLDDPANGSGSWMALYDSENLYVLVDITDDSLQNDSADSWLDDSVEVYFDGGNTKLTTALAGDDHQYTFGWTADDIQGNNIAGYTEGIEQAQATTETGWRIEIKMPWLSIQGAAPMAGDLIGIDCYYNDDDDGGDSRENKMLGFSAVEGWNDASQWGTAILAAEPKPVDPGSDGLVAYYALDNDANDSSGNGLDGTIMGEPNFVEGAVGMGLQLDGVDDYVDFGNDPIFDMTGEVTLALWVNTQDIGTSENNPWLGKGDTSYMIKGHREGNQIEFFIYDGGWVTAHADVGAEFNGEWHQAAGVFDGEKLIIYVDGEVGVSVDYEGAGIVPNTYNVTIGSNSQASGRFSESILDEAMIYNKALSQGEIRYLAGFRPPIDPVHSYTFQDGTGNDSVGQADGVLMGDAAIVDGSLVVDGNGDWMEMPGDVIAINTYSAMTLELWSSQSVDNAFSMTASFGGTWDNGMGKDYINIATGRGDQMNRGSIANTPDEVNPWEDEVGVSSPELNDGIEHHYVLTITAAELAYYVDGVLIGTAPLGETTISGVSNDFVYLGTGIYSVDPTMNCSINEFNIYDAAISDKQIADNYAAGPAK